MINYEEMIYNAIKQTIPMWLEIFLPIFIPIVIGVLILKLCKFFARKIVSFFSVIFGDSRGETRRKIKNSENLIDLISTINDIKPKK